VFFVAHTIVERRVYDRPVFVATSGQRSGAAVLFLHPLGLDHGAWTRQQAALDGEMYLLMPDLPGFGRSRAEECGLDQAVEECAEYLRGTERQAVLVGVSYGGYVAVRLAATHPDIVAGLAISGVRLSIPRSLCALQAAAFRTMPIGRLSRGESVPDEQLKVERQHLIEASRELGTIDLGSSARSVNAPAIVFAPSKDWFVRRHAPRLASAMPNARVVPISGEGHLWTDRKPEPLITAIRALAPRTGSN
jgi:pimeloyl-ACP methyl ester carboxylesterase